MKWNIKIYEEPGILFADRTVEEDEAPFSQTEELMKPGFEDGRKLLAVFTPMEGEGSPILCPQSPAVDQSFDELRENVTTLLGEGEPFAAASLVDGALKGARGQEPEIQLLAASIFEHIRFYDFVVPLLNQLETAFEDGLQTAAIQIRLARALRRSGQVEDVSDRLKEPLEFPDLPPILKAEGMLLTAISKGPEEGIEILDEMLDYAEEHLGDHRLVADALELHADFLSTTDPKKAEQFFHAAGKMLVTLQDPYFFSLNERFVVHFLKQEAYKEAIDLSHEMFELLKQAGGPPVASVPYFVFASHAHKAMGDQDRSDFATRTAREIHDIEARRIEEMLKLTLQETAAAS
jgi:tetratricopeptide (TPR) repeat protein